MAQHPSLKRDSKSIKHRSVWKRFERIKHLTEKGTWKEGDSVFGLTKIRSIKFKVKKEKAAATTAAAGAEGAAAPAAAGAQPAQAAKPAAAKSAAQTSEKGKDKK